MDPVDVVVVGGGLAGLATATTLAQYGVGVRLYAKGSFEGSPGGGIASGLTLAALGGPAMPAEVPYDRVLTERRWLFLSEAGDTALDFLDAPPLTTSEELRTVRNTTLAPFLAARARTLGADLRAGTPAEALRFDGRGRIAGVRVGGEEVPARVTVLADGGALPVNAKLRTEAPSLEVAERFWSMPARTVTARFGSKAGAGALTELLLGAVSPERPAGGYLLPFRSGVAVGVVAASAGGPPVPELLARVERHPSIAVHLRGATSGDVARTVLADRPERGRPLSGPGFLAVGRAAGLVAASGTRYLYLEAALRSGVVAAEVAREALTARDASGIQLSGYRLGLSADGLLGELAKARASGRRYRAAPGVASAVPRLLNATFHELMTERGGPKRRVLPTVRAVRRREKVSRRTLLRAALVAGRWR